jgi:hypothetical protein
LQSMMKKDRSASVSHAWADQFALDELKEKGNLQPAVAVSTQIISGLKNVGDQIGTALKGCTKDLVKDLLALSTLKDLHCKL